MFWTAVKPVRGGTYLEEIEDKGQAFRGDRLALVQHVLLPGIYIVYVYN